MAKFDLLRGSGDTLLVDCQSDLLDSLATRIVVPLLPKSDTIILHARLNPVIDVAGVDHVLATQFLTAVPINELGERVSSLVEHEYTIGTAIDVLLGGV